MLAHEQLIETYLIAHPESRWNDAYEKTADHAYDRMRENIAGHIDYLRLLRKEGGT